MSTNTNTFNESKKIDDSIQIKGMLMRPTNLNLKLKELKHLDKKRKYSQLEDYREKCGLHNPPVRSMLHGADNKRFMKQIDHCYKKVTKLSNKHKENTINKNDKV